MSALQAPGRAKWIGTYKWLLVNHPRPELMVLGCMDINKSHQIEIPVPMELVAE